MQLKILSKRTLLTVIFLGFAFSSVFFLYFVPKSSNQNAANAASFLINNAAAVLPKQEQAGFGLPLRLKIPGINVDAAVEYVGLASDGTMDVPKNLDNVAWFEFGPRPGDNGSAVIAGHYGRKNGKGSVFDDLHKLRQGDRLYIEDDKGVIISFVVRQSRRYDPEADASGVFGSSDGKPHLNFVTCEGTWDKASKTYPQRLVVFTDKE